MFEGDFAETYADKFVLVLMGRTDPSSMVSVPHWMHKTNSNRTVRTVSGQKGEQFDISIFIN